MRQATDTADVTTTWATDTMVSMPQPPKSEILIDMGTFGFTEFGLAHNITSADIENYTPNFIGRPQHERR